MIAFHAIGLAIPMGSVMYQLFAIWAVARHRDGAARASKTPGITVLKPVHGLDAGLYENLTSFCRQDYPSFQIVFAAASDSDPAVPVVRRVIAENPAVDATLVIDDRRSGSNNKISNVSNALPLARHGLIVIADSDMRVVPRYLDGIARAFEPPEVGAATCLYTGSPDGRLSSRLNSLYINDSFLPSVLVALRLDELRFCFGATMAVRRSVLDEVGGIARFGNYLADDYMLGKLVSDRGYRVALAPVVVENIVQESGLSGLLRHELRWARTVRTVRPIGYTMSIMTQSVALALLGWLFAGTAVRGAAILLAAMLTRIALHEVVRRRFRAGDAPAVMLIPLRELLNLLVWVASFLGSNVEWRGSRFSVASDGQMVEKEMIET